QRGLGDPNLGGRRERSLAVGDRAPENRGTFVELGIEVGLARLHLAAQLVAPGRGHVDPRAHGELPAAALLDPETRAVTGGSVLPLASLPEGTMDDAALPFADWLADAGQSWWQILPFAPPDRFGSPYAAASAFAGARAWLADPRAPVTADEVEAFVASHPE